LAYNWGKHTLSEFSERPEFAGLDQMRVSLALLPLRRNKCRRTGSSSTDCELYLVKHRDGRTNLADLLGVRKFDTRARVTRPSAAAAPIEFDIDA